MCYAKAFPNAETFWHFCNENCTVFVITQYLILHLNSKVILDSSFSLLSFFKVIHTWFKIKSIWENTPWEFPLLYLSPVITSIHATHREPFLLAYYESFPYAFTCSSVQSSCSVVSDSLRPHEPQHTRPPCPSPTPGVHPNPCPLSQWCHPTISSSVVPFSSCPQSFPASGSFQISQLFASGGQSIGVSASTSVLPMNTQDFTGRSKYNSYSYFLLFTQKITYYKCITMRLFFFLNKDIPETHPISTWRASSFFLQPCTLPLCIIALLISLSWINIWILFTNLLFQTTLQCVTLRLCHSVCL